MVRAIELGADDASDDRPRVHADAHREFAAVRRTPSTQLTIAALLRGDGDTRDVGSPST